jgi:hypothetical protein
LSLDGISYAFLRSSIRPRGQPSHDIRFPRAVHPDAPPRRVADRAVPSEQAERSARHALTPAAG